MPYTAEMNPYPKPAQLFSLLSDSPPAEANVARKPAGPQQGCVRTPDQPEPVYGAVVPVWITVNRVQP